MISMKIMKYHLGFDNASFLHCFVIPEPLIFAISFFTETRKIES